MVKILQSDEAKWRMVMEAVYGTEAPASCAVVGGEITFSAQPRPYSAKPDLKLLSEVLRSPLPLSTFAREWLADLFDPHGQSDYWVKTFARRDGKKKPVGISHNWDAAHYAAMLMLFGDRYDDPGARDSKGDDKYFAIEKAAKKFGLSETAVATALDNWLNAQREHAESL